jgi:hypothetical protein
MNTIRLNADFIIQIHKTQVNQPLRGDELLVFSDTLNQRQVQLDAYGFRSLANCYLLTLDTRLLAKLDLDLRLDILAAGSPDNTLVYTSAIALVNPDAQL